MTYTEFKTWVVAAIEDASPERRFAFAQSTVVHVLDSPYLSAIDQQYELDADAWAAFFEAKRSILTVASSDLKRSLAVIDAGTLTDGNMDAVLNIMLCAIECWADFRNTESIAAVVKIADMGINIVDWGVSPSIDDFLAPKQMQDERDRIAALLMP